MVYMTTINSIYGNVCSVLKSSLPRQFTDLEKRVGIIALVIFCSLVTCYMIWKFFIKVDSKPNDDKIKNLALPKDMRVLNPPEKELAKEKIPVQALLEPLQCPESLKDQKEKIINQVVVIYEKYLELIRDCPTSGSGRSVEMPYTFQSGELSLIFAAGARSLIRHEGQQLLEVYYAENKIQNPPKNFNVIVMIQEGFDSKTGAEKYRLAREEKTLLKEEQLVISLFEDMLNFTLPHPQIGVPLLEQFWLTPADFKSDLEKRIGSS